MGKNTPTPLTDTKLRKAKPTDKPYKLTDAGGLFVLVHPSGGKRWRYKYRFAGKEKLLSLGTYPDVSLSEARDRHAQARKVLAAGNDPSEVKKTAKRIAIPNNKTTYEAIAREWHENRKHTWTPSYAVSAMRRLEHHTFPKLGNRPIADITPPEMLSVVRVVEKSGALDMAQRVMQLAGRFSGAPL